MGSRIIKTYQLMWIELFHLIKLELSLRRALSLTLFENLKSRFYFKHNNLSNFTHSIQVFFCLVKIYQHYFLNNILIKNDNFTWKRVNYIHVPIWLKNNQVILMLLQKSDRVDINSNSSFWQLNFSFEASCESIPYCNPVIRTWSREIDLADVES